MKIVQNLCQNKLLEAKNTLNRVRLCATAPSSCTFVLPALWCGEEAAIISVRGVLGQLLRAVSCTHLMEVLCLFRANSELNPAACWLPQSSHWQ